MFSVQAQDILCKPSNGKEGYTKHRCTRSNWRHFEKKQNEETQSSQGIISPNRHVRSQTNAPLHARGFILIDVLKMLITGKGFYFSSGHRLLA